MAWHEPKLERDLDVRSTLKGRIDVEGGCVEIREFQWDHAGSLMAETRHVCISHLISPLKGDQRIRWYEPGDGKPVPVSLFGVHEPSAPMMITHAAGSLCFLLCRIELSRFRRITGTQQWPRDWALRGLSSESPFFKAILDRLTGEVLRPHRDSPAFVDALLTAFVIELNRVVRRESGSPERIGHLADWQLDRIHRLVQDSGPSRLTNAQIASRCGISVRHLTRAYRATRGITLHDHMAATRLARAREMLAEGRKPLKVVAAEAGFASASHFSATFRRAIGCSPSEYRAGVRPANTSA